MAFHKRKNFLFAGSDSGGDRAAATYTLIGTAKLCGLDSQPYLQSVLERIADHPINRVDDLLPWNVASQLRPIGLTEANKDESTYKTMRRS